MCLHFINESANFASTNFIFIRSHSHIPSHWYDLRTHPLSVMNKMKLFCPSHPMWYSLLSSKIHLDDVDDC